MEHRFSTIIEPFRIKSVEPLGMTTRVQRQAAIEEANWNVFKLHAESVLIDLLTDSGTGAMSAAQWAAMMIGDETYACARSFYKLEKVVRDLTGVQFVIPTHQGRAAEHILFTTLCQPGQVVPSNSHFDTTRANVEFVGAQAVDLLYDGASDPRTDMPFKGDLDVRKLGRLLADRGSDVPLVLVTITNNRGGGQPVSLGNLRAVRDLCNEFGVPLFLDAARFAENAWLIKMREPGQGDRTASDIARECFSLCDGFTMSAKKDGLVNIGGLLGLNDPELAERCRTRLILTEGFPTYGGLAGRDLEALAQGLQEVLDEDYLAYRHASVRYVFDRLDQLGVPMMRPPGGHAVYIDAAAFAPHIPAWQYPGVSLVNALYVEGGVRGVEVGTLMFGRPDPDGHHDFTANLELVRLTFPRRTYTQSHMDYLIEVVGAVWANRAQLKGYRIAEQRAVLRGFTASLLPLD
ncbi:MAG: tryptophanase [Deltaproteobacteria bacterium]|nr:tryptophanase [Deltaproteobacteria bacterium]